LPDCLRNIECDAHSIHPRSSTPRVVALRFTLTAKEKISFPPTAAHTLLMGAGADFSAPATASVHNLKENHMANNNEREEGGQRQEQGGNRQDSGQRQEGGNQRQEAGNREERGGNQRQEAGNREERGGNNNR
jgi:hypothetical protein